MPDSLLPGIAAGTNLISQGANMWFTTKQNALNMAYNNYMYNRQRNDALADWNRNNEYNSPAAQMARLKAAGLNPNLVYGNGAQMSAASPVRSSSFGSYHGVAPQVDLGGVLAQFMQTMVEGKQLDNMEKQGVLLDQELKNRITTNQLLRSKIDLTDTDAQLKGVMTSYYPKMTDTQIDALRAKIGLDAAKAQEAGANTRFKLDENERRAVLTSMSIREAAERILKMRAEAAYTAARTTLVPYEREVLLQRGLELERQIGNLGAITRKNTAEANYLESRPDWGSQQAWNAFESLIGGAVNGATRSGGLYLKPHQGVFDRRTGEIIH